MAFQRRLNIPSFLSWKLSRTIHARSYSNESTQGIARRPFGMGTLGNSLICLCEHAVESHKPGQRPDDEFLSQPERRADIRTPAAVLTAERRVDPPHDGK